VPAADVKRGHGQLYADFIEAVCRVTKDSVASPAGELLRLRGWQRELLGAHARAAPDGTLRTPASAGGHGPQERKKCLFVLGWPSPGWCSALRAERSTVAQRTVGRPGWFSMWPAAWSVMDPELSQRLKSYRDVIENPATGSVYRALSE
jgi:hypothetical protein